jgi:hypothetical protein
MERHYVTSNVFMYHYVSRRRRFLLIKYLNISALRFSFNPGRTCVEPISDVEFPVQKQLDAYNARDIDAFMQWWSDDCQHYEFPDRLIASGLAEMRPRYIARFREPNLFGKLVKRIVVDNVVIDQELVTRTFPDGPGEIDVIAIYEVSAGKIAKAWFKMGQPRLLPKSA